MIEWLKSLDWNTVITSLGVSGITIFAGFKFLLSKVIDSYFKRTDFYFAKQLEKYKRDLQDISEQTKFEYQRKLSDFNLYTTKKHEHYIKLYEEILNAYSYTLQLASALKLMPSYSGYNEDDISEHLKKLLLPKGKIDDLVALWKRDRTQAEREIREYVKFKEEFDAENAINQMKNIYLKSQLYLSPPLLIKLKDLNNQLFDLFINCKSEFGEQKERALRYEKSLKLKEIIDKHFEEIVDIMKGELSVGYYSPKDN